MPKRVIPKAVTWLSEEIASEQKISNSFRYYEKFQFKKIVGEIGDFVLISNADSSEPDTESGCDVARIVALYEDRSNKNDPFRAKVQWYSRPDDLPSSYFTKAEPYAFLEREVIEDHRPFDADVSIETFFTKCNITFTFTKDTGVKTDVLYNYICRYRLMAITKRKVNIEPVLEEERKAIELLSTPNKTLTPKTPNSLIKRLGRISISEQNNWSISKQDGSKILLKRAILADKIEKDSPKKLTPKTTPKKVQTPKSNKKLTSNEIEEVLSMELQENSDEELPTLIIRQHVPTTPRRRDSSDEELPTLIIRQHTPTTPKRKSVSRSKEDTPKRMLFRTDDKETCTRSGRASRKPVNYLEEELSPVKRTPRSIRKSDSNELIISKKSTLPEDDSDDDCLVSKTKIDRNTETSSIKRTARRLRNMSTDDDEIRTPKRSTRSRTPNLVNYVEDELSPVKKTPRALRKTTEADEFKRTPKKNTKVSEDSDDDDFKPMPKTPKTPRTPRTPRVTPGRTPKRSVTKKILTSQLTPSLRNRAHSVDNIDEFIKENKSLPGREQQMEEILSFVRTKLLDETSGCIYISGVPGTGKTATVCSALQILKEEPGLPDFHLVEVNGMRIAEPRQAYVQIYKQLTGKTVLWEQACSLLEKVFNNPRPRRTPTVLLVDELDALCTRRQDVLYSIMEWAAHSSALLTVLAVANTMDLPERALASRVASRLGLTRLTFPPYTHTQLQRIVLARLAGERVTADALQLVARKVAAVSGDARRALSLCSRALELAGADGAGLREVQLALSEASSSAAVRAIQSCAPAERLMLRAVAAEVERTGSDETTLSRALTTAAAIVALDGRPYRSASHVRAPRPAQARAACARLAAARLLLLEPRPGEPRLLLNVSADDVHYATRQITV